MSVIRAQMTMTVDSHLPADSVMNRLHFETFTTPATEDELDQITTSVEDFYLSFDNFLSPTLTGDLEITLYDLADPEPRIPVASNHVTLTPSTNDPFPSEVCAVLWFRSEAASGVNMQQRTNHVFLGPVAGNAQQVVSGIARPHASFRDAIRLGAIGLAALAFGDEGVQWVVRSETTGDVHPVLSGWVPDAWGTQRRRGESETTRTVFPIP